jgi:hypothetical protein
VKCNTPGGFMDSKYHKTCDVTLLIPQISYNCIRNDGSKWPKMYQITNKDCGDCTHLQGLMLLIVFETYLESESTQKVKQNIWWLK